MLHLILNVEWIGQIQIQVFCNDKLQVVPVPSTSNFSIESRYWDKYRHSSAYFAT